MAIAIGTWTPELTFLNEGDLNISYIVQTGLWVRSEELLRLDFTIVVDDFTHTTASGHAQITGIPFEVDQPISSIGILHWRGIDKPGFDWVNVSTRNATGNDRLVIRAAKMGGSDGLVNASDIPSGGNVDLAGNIYYRYGDEL